MIWQASPLFLNLGGRATALDISLLTLSTVDDLSFRKMVRGRPKAKIEKPMTAFAEPVRRSSRRQNKENQEKSDNSEKSATINNDSQVFSKSINSNQGKSSSKEKKGSSKHKTQNNVKRKVSQSSTNNVMVDNSKTKLKVTKVKERKHGSNSKATSDFLTDSEISVVKDISNKLKVDTIKMPPKKRRLSNLKLLEEFESPNKKVRVDPPLASKNVQKSSQIRYTSIASSISKNGIVGNNKNVPRKTLCNMDIIGLLEDELDAEHETEDNAGDKDENNLEEEEDPEISFKDHSSVHTKGSKVPVWHKNNTSKVAADESNVGDGDVFDPCNYGEEEFGPDKDKVTKKKVRKKKKETKAILTWGKNRKQVSTHDVRAAVKLTHNLETPGRKRPKPKRAIKTKIVGELAPLVLEDPPEVSPSVSVRGTNCDTDESHGAQNFFDSLVHPPAEFLQGPAKVYTTPLIPKKLSRFKDNSSTPNVSAKPAVTATLTVKELVKKAFGFDSEEELRYVHYVCKIFTIFINTLTIHILAKMKQLFCQFLLFAA